MDPQVNMAHASINSSTVSRQKVVRTHAPDLSIIRQARQAPPKMPLDGFGALAPWIEKAAKARGAPVDYVGATALVMSATAIGTTREAVYNEWKQKPIIWAALVGFPSDGKSPALEIATDVARTVELDAAEGHKLALAEWETGAESAKIVSKRWRDEVETATKNGVPPPLRPADAVEPEKPARPRMAIADATTEAMAQVLAQQPRGVVIVRDELAALIGGFDRYSGAGADRAFVLEAHEGRPFVIDRKSTPEPLRVPFNAMSIVGGIQPDKLDAITDGSDDGFAGRFLFVWPERPPFARVGNAPGIGPLLQVTRRLRELRHNVDTDGNPSSVGIPLSADAIELIEAYRQELHRMTSDEGGLIGTSLGKMPGRAMRLALTFELLAWATREDNAVEPTEISADTMASAIAFLDDYAVPMLRRAIGEAGLPQAERDAASIARRIAKDRPTVVNSSAARKARWLQGKANATRYAEAFAELVDAKWLLPDGQRDGDTLGRKTSDFRVAIGLFGALDEVASGGKP